MIQHLDYAEERVICLFFLLFGNYSRSCICANYISIEAYSIMLVMAYPKNRSHGILFAVKHTRETSLHIVQLCTYFVAPAGVKMHKRHSEKETCQNDWQKWMFLVHLHCIRSFWAVGSTCVFSTDPRTFQIYVSMQHKGTGRTGLNCCRAAGQ